MKCLSCDSKKNMKRSIKKIKYDECGLDYVTLDGVEVFECGNCGETLTNYGNMNEIHQLICDFIILKSSTFSGPEVRFLRKNLGYSTEMFAHILGVSKRTIERAENGVISPLLNTSIRLLIANRKPDRNYNLHDEILSSKEKKQKKESLVIEKVGQIWESLLVAV